MKLNPRACAGRTNRRARALCGEIERLHRDGYSYIAIRDALSDAGVHVSKSTVQREVARLLKGGPPALVPALLASPVAAATFAEREAFDATRRQDATRAAVRPPSKGNARALAEAFFKGQITNPLLKNRSRS